MFVLGNAKKNMLSKKEEANKYYNEDYDIDLKNKNDSHAIIVNNLSDYNKILDVGCGVGYIAKKMKEISNATIDGIEIDKKARRIAAKYHNRVYDFSIEDKQSPEYKDFMESKDKYDCIVLADLIEHLIDPGETFFALSKKLSEDGAIIVSTPNIAHIDIISNLVDGKFNYNVTGILDSTHVKFFTESSFYEFIENVNEKYGLDFGVKLIGVTYAKQNDKMDDFVYDMIGEELYKFQNVFLVAGGIKIKRIKSKDFYKKINDNYVKMKANAERNEMRIKELEEELNLIMNSKSWKITEPLRRVMNVAKKRGGRK